MYFLINVFPAGNFPVFGCFLTSFAIDCKVLKLLQTALINQINSFNFWTWSVYRANFSMG